METVVIAIIAIINGRQTEVGDTLSTDGSVIVADIGVDYVVLEAEGVKVTRRKVRGLGFQEWR